MGISDLIGSSKLDSFVFHDSLGRAALRGSQQHFESQVQLSVPEISSFNWARSRSQVTYAHRPKVSCWLGPWDYSDEGTQRRSLGGFLKEGLGDFLSKVYCFLVAEASALSL